jgi:hypothetical protein
LLWELVTSRRLFSGLPDMEALRAVRDAQVPRPREFHGTLSPEIDALIMSTLSPEPRARPTAGQLGAKLRSLRYSLDVTVGDPATELAKIIDTAEDVERQGSQHMPPPRGEFEGSEATVIRIHTADAFSMRDKDGTGMARAREVIDRFEEEETRQALLSRDQMAFLRAHAQRDSGELSVAVEPPLPGLAPTRTSDELTHAHEPISTEDLPTLYPGLGLGLGPGLGLGGGPEFDSSPGSGDRIAPGGLDERAGDRAGDPFSADEATRLLGPGGRRTPVPERPVRPATHPPAMPGAPPGARLRPPTPGPPVTPPPGTVHDRSGRGQAPARSAAAMAHPAPSAMQVTPVVAQPPSMQSMQQSPMQSMQSPMQSMQPPMQSMQPPMQSMQPPMQPMQQPMQPMQPAPMQPMQPAPMPQPPQAGYGNWGLPQQMPAGASPAVQAMYDRRPPNPPHRAGSASPQRFGRVRRTPLRPWMLVIGALIMALLAFAVTRACIHTATSRPVPAAR